ncbi:hypothetical protein JW835_06330 [bacterium]|nr:hypothetical protein [bacterium]
MCQKRDFIVFIAAAIMIIGLSLLSAADHDRRELTKTATYPDIDYFNPNRIFSWMVNDGTIVTNAKTDDAGMYWPSEESGLTINFASGLWVAGKVSGVPRTACAEFTSEWTPGKVLPDGEPDNPHLSKYRLYIVNKNDGPENPDVAEWPVQDGAPWIDADDDGVYNAVKGDRPDMIGDQMIWYVMNDLTSSAHTNLFKTAPIGLECRVTLWGFDRSDILGDMIFAKFQLYNKKEITVDSCYLGIWADIDLGDGTDDFCGCDTTLSLGYVYNDGADAMYGQRTPAIGYDFFQGAIVPGSPGDTAKAFGGRIPGYKNLGMDVFIDYVLMDPSTPDPETGTEAFYYMSGFHHDGTPFEDLNGRPVVPARVYSGDPVTGTGWRDAESNPSGDRRILQSCGPFVLAPGDSQEVVAGIVIAQGSDYLRSVSQLKRVDKAAQKAYDANFDLLSSPQAPVVHTGAFNGEIVLTWEDNAEASEGFEGYNVYQYETNTGLGARRLIATFDLDNEIGDILDVGYIESIDQEVEHVLQHGSNSGLRHYLVTKTDALRGNERLINNRPYYFLVTAYAYSDIGIPSKFLESSTRVNLIQEVFPQDPFGRSHPVQPEDSTSVPVTHTGGNSDGFVSVILVDPNEIAGHDYRVDLCDQDGTVVWRLTEQMDGDAVTRLEGQLQGHDASIPLIDGMLVNVINPDPGLKRTYQTDDDGNRVDEGISILEFSPGIPSYIVSTISGTVNSNNPKTTDFDQYGLWGTDDFEVDFGDSSVAWDYRTQRVLTEKVPFAMYRHHCDTGEKERLYITIDDGYNAYHEGYAETEETGLGVWDTTGFGSGMLNYFSAYEPIYAYISSIEPYDPAKENEYQTSQFLQESPGKTGELAEGNPVRYAVVTGMVFVEFEDAGIPENDRALFITNKLNTPEDRFEFSTKGLTVIENDSLARMDVKRINVFPNPYFGSNAEEMKPLEHFVRFTHLPPRDTIIRIYNLAGGLVRTLNHDNGSQFEVWDLQNEFRIPVASGMYIAHVDCANLGEKILKLALIMPEERLRQY